MAEVCTPNLEGASSIAARPLNLTLLTKKRLMEDELCRGDAAEDADHKRQKLSDEHFDGEDERLEVVDDDPPTQHEQNSDECDKSKSSILEHFYSFIRRKSDRGDVDPSPTEEEPKRGDRDQTSPDSVGENHILESERMQSQRRRHNGGHSPPVVPTERAILDYSAAFTRNLAAARTRSPYFMDIWSAVAANALACKAREVPRPQAAVPAMIARGSEYDSKMNFATSPVATNAIPERTMRQNNWAVKVWRDWAIERNSNASVCGKTGHAEIVPMDIKDASLELMSYWLPKFITEVRRRDKRPYPPDTLMQIASGLQRHLRHVSGRSDITFFDKYSPTFAEFREALKARSDAINNETSTARREMNHNMSPQHNEAGLDPWSSSLFNLNTAKGLFRSIFYYNCVNFHITSMEEHHSLLVSQFCVVFDETRQEYLEFTRENGEVTRKFATPYDPRCIVKVFKKYFACIPSTGLLYKRPLQSTEGTDLRFSFNPVGINKLRETFKTLFGRRRTGSHLPVAEDDEEREGPPNATVFRFQSVEDDSRRVAKFDHSPGSNASSGRDEDCGEENRQPSEEESAAEGLSPVRTVIAYAPDSRVPSEAEDKACFVGSAKRHKVLEENINNNSSAIEDENSLTMKVPAYVKSVIILQGSKRFQVDLTGMN